MRDLAATVRDNLLAALAACQAEGLPFKPTKLELEYMKRAKDWKLPIVEGGLSRDQLPTSWRYIVTLEAHGETRAHPWHYMEVGKAYIQTRDPYFLTLWRVPNEKPGQ